MTVLPAVAAAAVLALPAPPMVLPGEAGAAATRTWLIGARPAAAPLLRREHARRLLPGAWVVSRARARETARLLRRRGLLTYAEPDRVSALRQAPRDPLSDAAPWRDSAVDPTLDPPAVTADSPLLALVDAKIDTSHPEMSSVATLPEGELTGPHGTATAAVAAAPANGVGIVGVWPGMRALNVPLPSGEITCSDSAQAIVRAIAGGAQVINLSYGSSEFCQTEYQAVQLAVRRKVTVVAAAGNEFDQGNPLEFPASLPHVLTVGALAPGDRPAYFSNENAAIDLVAPGTGILTAVPPQFDDDGAADGYQQVDGTSFAAPMVAAAAAWVRARRPELTVDQVAQVVRISARDIGDAGYDTSTGFGALDLDGALVQDPPISDPFEPNDDIAFVDGSAFGAPQRALWRGRGDGGVTALLDVYEDPTDVYRVLVPGRTRVRFVTRPRFGNPDIELYRGGARAVGGARHRIARSRRTNRRTDEIRWRNRSRRTRTVYLRVWVRPDQPLLDASYRLSVR